MTLTQTRARCCLANFACIYRSVEVPNALIDSHSGCACSHNEAYEMHMHKPTVRKLRKLRLSGRRRRTARPRPLRSGRLPRASPASMNL